MAKALATADASNVPTATKQEVSLPPFTSEQITVTSVRVFFDGKPSAQVREYMKSFGMRFQPGNEETLGRAYWTGTVEQLAGTPFIS